MRVLKNHSKEAKSKAVMLVLRTMARGLCDVSVGEGAQGLEFHAAV